MEKAKKKVEAISPELKPSELNEILFPELSKDSFKLLDNEYRIRVLPWKWEIAFRDAVLPIVEHEFKPFEKVIYAFSTELHLLKEDMQITETIIDTERKVDAYLTRAVAIICVSQDEETLRRAAVGEEMPMDVQAKLEKKYRIMIENAPDMVPSPRIYLREIVRAQMAKHEMVQRLGESLMARFDEFARLAGQKETFDSLKQTFTLQVRNYMDLVGSRVSTLASSSTQPTANLPATSSRIPQIPTPAEVAAAAERAAETEKSMEATELAPTSA